MSIAHDAIARPRFFPDFQKKTAMPASVTSELIQKMNIGPFGTRGSTRGMIREGAVVETVSVEVAELEPGVAVGCESEQDDRVGTPEQASVTGLVKAPNFEPIVTV